VPRQYLNGRAIDREAAHLMGLGVLLDRLTAHPNEVPAHRHGAVHEIDVRPAQREDLRASHTRHHHQPDERSPRVVLQPRSRNGPRGGRCRWRIGLGHPLTRLLDDIGGVGPDPPPPDGRSEHSAQDPVNLADR